MATEYFDNDQAIKQKNIKSFAVNAVINDYLQELAQKGFYGTTPNEVARTLIYDSIRRMVQSGEVDPIKYVASHHAPESKENDSNEK